MTISNISYVENHGINLYARCEIFFEQLRGVIDRSIQLFVAYGQYTSRKIGFASMSFAETWTMSVIAFVISAVIHCAGDYMLTSTVTISQIFPLTANWDSA